MEKQVLIQFGRRISLDNQAENACSSGPVALQELIDFRPHGASHWATMASTGAHSTTHIDANGVHTYAEICSGAKLWLTAMPKPGCRPPLLSPTADDWQMEVLRGLDVHCTLLRAGDAL
jgi:hypothetical protein